MSPDDRRWLWIVYGLLLVPVVGPALLILGSSVGYYAWRKRWPDAAARLNRHAWLAIAVNLFLNIAVCRLWRS